MNHAILFALIFTIYISFPAYAEEQSKQKPLFPVSIPYEFDAAERSFNEIRQLILKNYYTTAITETGLYWAAVKGMLRHISPPDNPKQSKIWAPEEYDKVLKSLKGVKGSLGIKSSFNPSDGSVTIKEVMEGSPAASLLLPYDRILRIDGEPLKGKKLEEISGFLEGERGTDILLTVSRDIKVFELRLKLKEFKANNLLVSTLAPGDFAFVEIKKITANLSQELKEVLTELQEKNIDKLILDLRNNTGGVFIEALKTAELFLPAKNIILRTLSRSDKPQNYISSNEEPFDFKMAILVNNKTASGCEIIVAALQDNKKSIIIGAKTFGKAVFEKTFKIENNYRIKFISGAMYTPLGKSWQSRGITPDFETKQDQKTYAALTKLSPPERLKKDVPLITAYKLLKR